MQPHVILALARKELSSYFSSPTGYVFITLFVFLSGLAAFWVPAFFDRNLANLDQLNAWFGVLLLFLIPAITMGLWAEERRQGTAELLMTLPARDAELVLGKYLGALAIYAICLLFAASHWLVLAYLGRPDAGVMISTYLGYLLAGGALVGVGLAASALSSSATISYIAGAVACGAFVAVGRLADLLPDSAVAELARAVDLPTRLESLNRGVIDLADAAYFAGVAVLGLSVCTAVVASRRVAGARGAGSTLGHGIARVAALVVFLGAAVVMLERAAARADLSAERLWSLSPQTRALLRELPEGRTLAVTAYLSPKVPESFVQQRETVIGLLREVRAASGGRVQTRVVPTEPGTAEAREADRTYGISPRTVPSERGGVAAVQPVFMGLAVSGGAAGAQDDAVTPFLGRGLSAEYELARAIRSASQTARKRVGVVVTPAGLLGEFDFQTMQPGQDWPIIRELRKQYEIVRVQAESPIQLELDAMIVAQPSSLPEGSLTNVLDAINRGVPALIIEDPLPGVNPALATALPQLPPTPQDRGVPPGPKPGLGAMEKLLGVRVPGEWVVWDTVNPHPELAETPQEFIWAARGAWRGGEGAFNDEHPTSAGLQETVHLFSGRVESLGEEGAGAEVGASGEGAVGGTGTKLTFTPLIRSSPSAGQMAAGSVLQRTPFGAGGLNPQRRPERTNRQQVLAAEVSGPGPVGPIRAIVVADLDMMAETFFAIREQGLAGLEFDNVTFVLNAVDALTGESSLVDLRKRRREFRTLERVEAQRQAAQQATIDAVSAAEQDARRQADEARARFEARVKEIEARTDVDATTRRIMAESVRASEQRRLDAEIAAIEDERIEQIEDVQLSTREKIERLQMTIRMGAVALPPVPALAVGLVVLARRRALRRPAGPAPSSGPARANASETRA